MYGSMGGDSVTIIWESIIDYLTNESNQTRHE